MIRGLFPAVSAFAAVLAWSGPASSADLALSVAGIANEKGNVMIAVFDKAATFRDAGAAVAAIRIRARRGVVKVILPNLPAGTYAVSAFHDENGDQKLDMNMLGMPTEGYGFSKDARGVMGPPSFEEAAVKAANGVNAVSINLEY